MEWWGWLIFAGGAAVCMTVFLVVNACQTGRNHYLVALAVLFFTIMLTSLIAAASFVPAGWSGIPLVVFVLWFILFCIAEGVFLIFFFRPTSRRRISLNSFHRKYKTNPLKGWGGATFAEYSGIIGLLVTVGVYRVFDTEQGSYWWMAQIAAIVSVISTAAWVQRYILEGPEKDDKTATFGSMDRSRSDYFKKTFPTLLNGFSAALTVLAICVPVESNNAARNAAIGNHWLMIFALWILIFMIWLFIALIPTRIRVLSWPVWGTLRRMWGNRENLQSTFLYPIVFLAAFSLILIFSWFITPDTEWGNGWAIAFGTIPAFLYIFSVIWKAIVDGYPQGNLWFVCFFRDFILCVAGLQILIGQIISAWVGDGMLRDGVFADIYLFGLILMIGISLFNLVTAAYQWSTKRPYEEQGPPVRELEMQILRQPIP